MRSGSDRPAAARMALAAACAALVGAAACSGGVTGGGGGADAAAGADARLPEAARFTAVDLPAELTAGGWTYRATWTVVNDGTETWTPGDFALSVTGRGAELIGASRLELDAAVGPGQEHTFAATITSPAERGEYATGWQMIDPAGDGFGERVDRTVLLPGPRFIEFGWDTPRTAAEAAAVDLAHAPFDGAVLDPRLLMANGSEVGLAGSVLASAPLTDETLERDTRTSGLLTAFQGLPDNLLRVNAAALAAPWGGDWSAVLDNVEVAGRLVHQYGMRGLMFDTEMYGTAAAWNPAGGGTPEQARARGRELGARWGAAAPDTTIVFTMAHTYVALLHGVGNHDYDLMAPFIDGLMEGAPESIAFVDGYEISYGFRQVEGGGWFPDSFPNARQHIRDARDLSLVPELYDRRMRAGFGIWLDYDSTWDAGNPANNHFTPDGFAASLTAARDASDGWVWVYTQKIDWYVATAVPGFDPVPDAYRTPLAAARQ